MNYRPTGAKHLGKLFLVPLILALLSGSSIKASATVSGERLWEKRFLSRTPLEPPDGPGDPLLSVNTNGHSFVAVERTIYKYDPLGQRKWSKKFGFRIRAVRPSAHGWVYLAGYDGYSDGFGPGSGRSVITKLDRFGTRLWTVSPPFPWLSASAVDGAGNSYAAITSRSWPGSNDEHKLFKYGPGGRLLWSRTYRAQADRDFGEPIITADPDGNILLALTDYKDDNSEYFEGGDLLVLKYDPSGQRKWVRRLATGTYEAEFIETNRAGNVFVAAQHIGSFDSDDNYSAIRTVKYDASGNLKWERLEKKLSGGYPYLLGMAVGPAGNIYVAAFDNSRVLYDLVKYDGSNGGRLWEKSYGAGAQMSNFDIYSRGSLSVDPDGAVRLAGAGYFGGRGGYNYMAVKIDAAGNKKWTRYIRTPEGWGYMPIGAVDTRSNMIMAGVSIRDSDEIPGYASPVVLTRFSP